MQLPTYVYLVQKGLKEKCLVNGFYLQQVLTSQPIDSDDIEKDIKKNLKLNGYTINNEQIINQIDNTYQNSEIISGMKTTKTGFYAFTKIINENEINKLVDITNNHINNMIDKILNADFEIKPKRLKNENISCKYCQFKDICFVKENDIQDIKEVKFKDIIGGKHNAQVD